MRGLRLGRMYLATLLRLNATTLSLIMGRTSRGILQLSPINVLMLKSSYEPGFNAYQHFSLSRRSSETTITPVKSVTVRWRNRGITNSSTKGSFTFNPLVSAMQ